MKPYLILCLISLLLLTIFLACQNQHQLKVYTSTNQKRWYQNNAIISKTYQKTDSIDIEILTAETEQTIDCFGGCFNELGWDAPKVLNDADRVAGIKSLFSYSVKSQVKFFIF